MIPILDLVVISALSRRREGPVPLKRGKDSLEKENGGIKKGKASRKRARAYTEYSTSCITCQYPLFSQAVMGSPALYVPFICDPGK